MEKKIVVPDDMLRAVSKNHIKFIRGNINGEDVILSVLYSALRWLSENPIVPNAKQLEELFVDMGHPGGHFGNQSVFLCAISNWQRRMFLAPEPELPEAIKDLMWSDALYTQDEEFWKAVPRINQTIAEAYRRGQNSK